MFRRTFNGSSDRFSLRWINLLQYNIRTLHTRRQTRLQLQICISGICLFHGVSRSRFQNAVTVQPYITFQRCFFHLSVCFALSAKSRFLRGLNCNKYRPYFPSLSLSDRPSERLSANPTTYNAPVPFLCLVPANKHCQRNPHAPFFKIPREEYQSALLFFLTHKRVAIGAHYPHLLCCPNTHTAYRAYVLARGRTAHLCAFLFG